MFVAFWLLFSLSCDAAEDIIIKLDKAQNLLYLVGTDGVRVTVGRTTFYWDRGDTAVKREGVFVRPRGADTKGGWRLDDGGRPARQAGVSDVPSPFVCASSLSLKPQPSGELTNRVLQVLASKAASSGCPVTVKRGVHPIDRDIVLSVGNVAFYCESGAVFSKTGPANAFWFKGKNIRMIGQCEIDGGGFPGSGLIIDFSAQDSRVESVYSHHHGGHGVLNRGVRTTAEYVRTERNGEIGFANDGAKAANIRYLLSRENGNEGLTIDNPGAKSIRVVGGFIEGNCHKGGIGNVGVDAAEDVVLEGVILRRPHLPCGWNLTAQNNAGNTDRLTIRGGYFSEAAQGDIYFRTNVGRGYSVRDSAIIDVLSLSNGSSVVIDPGGERNSVSVRDYSGRIVIDKTSH